MITVVSDSGADTKFTILATVKEVLGISGAAQDALLTRLIDTVSDGIPEVTNKVWAQSRVKETLPGYGDQILMVTRTPLTVIHAIKFDGGDPLDVTEFSIEDPDAGMIFREVGWQTTARVFPGGITPDIIRSTRNPGALDWEVEYTGGFVMFSAGSETLPNYFQNLAIQAIAQAFFFQDSKRSPFLKQKKLGDFSETYETGNQTLPSNLVADLFAKEVRVV